MSRRKKPVGPAMNRPKPAETAEGREAQLIAEAYNLVEKRLLEGTATSQETTFFLKLGSTRAGLEKQLMETQVELAKAKTSALKSEKEVERLYANAISAFKSYSGNTSGYEEADDDESDSN